MRIFFLLIILFIYHACAQVKSPEGGPEDKTPPQIVLEESTANGQTNFRPDKLEFTFDEWSKLASRGREVIISPETDRRPRFYFKRKSLIVEFSEEDTLRPNTTYLLQFGNEVVDLTEQNPVRDFTFVFSTGPYLDSLSLSGSCLAPESENDLSHGFALLFDTLIDTPFRYQQPYYRTPIDSGGSFRFDYLKEGSYFLVCYLDKNENNRYDSYDEFVGFADTLFNPIHVKNTPILSFFKEEEPPFIKAVDSLYLSDLLIEFSTEPTTLKVTSQRPILKEVERNSLHLYFLDTLYPKSFFLQDSLHDFYDTIFISKKTNKLLPGVSINRAATAASIDLKKNSKSVTTHFDVPVRLMDTSKIKLFKDSLELPIDTVYPIDTSKLSRRWTIKAAEVFRQDSSYTLSIFPNAFQNLWQESTMDTISLSLRPREIKGSGQLNIRINSLDSSLQYVLEIKNRRHSETLIIKEQTTFKATFPDLTPGKYKVYISEDINQDGRWTPGDIDKRRPAEPRHVFEPEEIRENWESDFTIEMK